MIRLLQALYSFTTTVSSASLAFGAAADAPAPNVVSSIVSYEYIDDFSDAMLSNGSIVSPVVSYSHLDSLSGSGSTIVSPLVSYQYLEWPGDDILKFFSSPVVSYFWQIGNGSGPAVLHGWVTDNDGVALPSATISARVLLAPIVQATTDANGFYEMPALGAGVYDLWAIETSHQTSMRGLTLNTSTARQDFQLKPMPPRPIAQQVNRSPTVDYTVSGIMDSVLRIFDGSSFVLVGEDNWPSANLKTIVMTHGWVRGQPDPSIMNTSFDRWPTNMAVKLQAQGINPANANIVAWDWRYAAAATLLNVGTPADRTPDQGIALGEALLHFLGPNYTQPLHFLGHSLGTLVNASAINYLHGETIGTEDHSPTPWRNNLVHVTLFDQAQVAETVGTSPTAQSALPYDFTWADNYKSLVGLGNLAGAVNVDLQKGITTSVLDGLNPLRIADDAHGYPIDWYQMSILTPLDMTNPLGFKRSYEFAPSLFPPSDVRPGAYHQTPFNYDELALEPVDGVSSFGLWPDAVLQTTIDTIQYSTGVAVQIVDTVDTEVPRFFNFVSDVATQGRQSVVNFVDSTVLKLNLSTVPPVSPLPTQEIYGFHLTPLQASSSSPFTEPVVWLPIQFPANAAAMTLDVMVEGDPANDVLVCGIGTNNLLSLPAKYISTNQLSPSRFIDVSAWAGTTNELFIGFMGGTSTDATLQIQNIRFYSFKPPKLTIVQSGQTILLEWPSSIPDYFIASKTDLATSNWESIVTVPTIVGNNYVVTSSLEDQARFFRLQQQ